MRKLYLTLLGAAVALNAWAVDPNVYAYGLSATPHDATNGDHQVTYSLNAPATSVTLEILNPADGSVVGSRQLNGLAKGENTVTVNLQGIPVGNGYRWQLVVNGTPRTAAQLVGKVTGDTQYWVKGVYVENDQTSPMFGNIYFTQPYGAYTAAAKAGVFACNPQFELLNTNSSTPYFNDIAWYGNGGPLRFGASAVDGKVLLTAWSDNATSGVYVFEPANISAGVANIFGGTHQSGGRKTSASGAAVCGSVAGAWAIERNGQVCLYTCDEDLAAVDKPSLAEYVGIDYTTPWAVAPTFALGNFNSKVGSANSSVVADNHGGMWVYMAIQSPSATAPYLLHLNAENALDYSLGDKTIISDARMGAIAVNPDGNTMYCGTGNDNIVSLDVVWDTNGVPSCTKGSTISDNGGWYSQMALDHANNLYVARYSTAAPRGGVDCIALPGENSCTTVCPTAFDIVTGVDDAVIAADPASDVLYNAAGQRVDASYRGIVIVRHADGTAKKMLNVK